MAYSRFLNTESLEALNNVFSSCYRSPPGEPCHHWGGDAVPDRRRDQPELHLGEESSGIDPTLVHQRTAGNVLDLDYLTHKMIDQMVDISKNWNFKT